MHEDGSWEDDSDTEFLAACCGSERPWNKDVKLVVLPAEGCDFVTIRDYVSGEFGFADDLRAFS